MKSLTVSPSMKKNHGFRPHQSRAGTVNLTNSRRRVASFLEDVEDNGRGITEEDLSRIFSPFFGTNPSSAGLGLPAVRRIARAHGGRVEVVSTVGRGSTFMIRLPREFMH